MKKDEKYLTSAESCQMLVISRSELWSMAGVSLTPPILESSRKALWLRKEIEELAAKKRRQVA